MSLTRIALRHCLVQALKGKTIAGDNVLDSRIGAIEAAADGTLSIGEKKAFVAIYTDAGKTEPPDQAIKALGAGGTVQILFETGVTAGMEAINEETGESEVLPGIPATDAAFEFHIDFIGAQIAAALADPANEWADIFRGFCTGFSLVERLRTSNDRDGVRLAAQQLRVTADLIDEPVSGVAIDPETPFGRFLAKLDASEEPSDQTKAALFRGLLAGADADWVTVQRRLGLTDSELLALGLGPLANDADRATPPMETGTLATGGTAPVDVE
jgi:hypothetical protein